MLDWNERKQLAETIAGAGLNRRLVSPWNPTECVALAVFVPMSFEGGHWVEVQPRDDPARRLSAGVKAYVLPVPADDPVLHELAAAGLLSNHGGTWLNSVVTLDRPAPLYGAARNLARIGAQEAAWLAQFARNNRMPTVGELLSVEAVNRHRLRAREQRTRAGRIEAALLVWAYALEKDHPEKARRARAAARDFGNFAFLLGDESTLDFRSESDHRRFQANLAAWGREIRCFDTGTLPTEAMDRIHSKLTREY